MPCTLASRTPLAQPKSMLFPSVEQSHVFELSVVAPITQSIVNLTSLDRGELLVGLILHALPDRQVAFGFGHVDESAGRCLAQKTLVPSDVILTHAVENLCRKDEGLW